MIPAEVIKKKRDGKKLSTEELQFFIKGYLDGTVTDYQMSAFLMAVYYRGMDSEETMHLTELMLHSGEVIDLSHIPGIKVDKHSTGGVGDKVSLILAPLVAACGVLVPMISGRGLGHTGGTLDKLESIPSFRTNLSIDEYIQILGEIGIVMIGQTNSIVPADKKMYALRDVTATVESIPLIAGSIMSKKLAEGIDALVLDVKTGRGAFMKDYDQAVELAQTLVRIGNDFGKKTVGFITNMNQPLGHAIGNWMEVVESVQCLHGEDIRDLMEVTYVLAGAMVMLGGKANTIDEGLNLCKETIRNGKAYKKFLELVQRQGGDISYIENLEKYSYPEYSFEIKSSRDGYVTSIDAFEIGMAALELGAGRVKVNDAIDPKAGIVLKKKIGYSVQMGEPLAVLYTDSEEKLSSAKDRCLRAFTTGAKKVQSPPLILSIVKMEDSSSAGRDAQKKISVLPWKS